jgi:uncharacterized membrane protein YdjX (TVP38/TMEM64 family)
MQRQKSPASETGNKSWERITAENHDAWLKSAVLLLLLFMLVTGWHFTPWASAYTEQNIQAWFESIRQFPCSGVLIVFCFALLAVAGVPISGLTITTGVLAGPWWGFVYAMSGGMASGLTLFGIGRLLRRIKRRPAMPGRFMVLVEKFRRRAIVTLVAIRIAPVLPFFAVCALAGAARLRWRDFAVGTMIGSIPGALTFTVFVDGLRQILQRPSVEMAAMLLAMICIVAVVGWTLRRRAFVLLRE